MNFCIDMITRMLNTTYSQRGSSERVKEETTFMLFLDLLHECEGTVCILFCGYIEVLCIIDFHNTTYLTMKFAS